MFCITGCGYVALENGYCYACSPKPDYIKRCTSPTPFILEKCSEKEITTEMKNEASKQVNKSKCWKCNKKVGLLGFECSCQFTFCKHCRYAEDHDCTFDFSKDGKEQIKKNNPLVNGTKLKDRL